MIDAALGGQAARAAFTLDQFENFTPEGAEVQDNRIVGFDSRDKRSRAFNLLRTSLTKTLEDRGCRLVGVTSATPAAGKSFLAMNLAASLSRVADHPVFLADLDLRRASLGDQIGLVSDSGLAAHLAGSDVPLEKIGRRIAGTNLVVFPTGQVTANSAELVAGATFEAFVEDMRRRTGPSIVIFDLPPAFASDDTMLIMQQLDGYIVVVDSGKTTKRQVREVVRLMDPTPCVGTIMNRYREGITDSYGYGYGSNAYANYYE